MACHKRLLCAILTILLAVTVVLGLASESHEAMADGPEDRDGLAENVGIDGPTLVEAAEPPAIPPTSGKIPIPGPEDDELELSTEDAPLTSLQDSTNAPAPASKDDADQDNKEADKPDDIDDSPIRVNAVENLVQLEIEEAVLSVRKAAMQATASKAEHEEKAISTTSSTSAASVAVDGVASAVDANANAVAEPPANSETMPLRFTGTSMLTMSQSGTTTTSLALVTFDPSHTKMRRCIYGCGIITVTATGTITSTSAVTVLPVTIPCSLLICPPCGCTTKVISATGCPVITTVIPPDSTITVTANATITFITVTETSTVTNCSTTACDPTTVTVLVSPSRTTVTQYSTEQVIVTPTPEPTDPTSTSNTGPPIVTLDPGCPCGYDGVEEEEEEEEEEKEILECPCQNIGVNDPHECAQCQVYYFAAAGVAGAGTTSLPLKDVPRTDKTTGRTKQKKKKKRACKPCKSGQAHLFVQSVSTSSSQPSLPYTRTINGGVCSTFIVCHPKQFQCPAQVTAGSQLPDFLSAWSLLPETSSRDSQEQSPQEPSNESQRPSPHVANSYVGFDGKEHPIGPEPIPVERKAAGSEGTGNDTPGEGATRGRSDIKGFKVAPGPEVIQDDGKIKAAGVKNAARPTSGFPHGSVGMLLLLVALAIGL